MAANLITGARDVLDSLRAERWLVVGAVMTAVSGIAAFALIPVTGMVNAPDFGAGLLWITLTAVVVGCHVVVETIKMARSGHERPLGGNHARGFAPHRSPCSIRGIFWSV